MRTGKIYIYKATARTAKQTTVQNALINTANSSLPLDFYHHHFLRWLFSCQELFAPNFVHFIWGVLLKAKAPLSHEVLTMNAYGISITQYNQRHPHNTHTHFFLYSGYRAQAEKYLFHANFNVLRLQ